LKYTSEILFAISTFLMMLFPYMGGNLSIPVYKILAWTIIILNIIVLFTETIMLLVLKRKYKPNKLKRAMKKLKLVTQFKNVIKK